MRIVAKEFHHDDSNEWGTPDELFGALNGLYGPYVIDVACTAENTRCHYSLTREKDALTRSWGGRMMRAWCNPPYGPRGSLDHWVSYARAQVLDALSLVTLLVPHYTADGWWQHVVDPEGPMLSVAADWTTIGLRTRYTYEDLVVDVLPIRGRVRFKRLDGSKATCAAFSSCAVTFSRSGVLGAYRA